MRANTTISLQQARQPCDGVICDQLANNERLMLLINAHFLMQSGEAGATETGRAAAFIDRETDGDVSSSAAASSAGGDGRGETGSVLAVCPLHRIDDEQHVDTVAPTMSIHTFSTQGIALDVLRRHRGAIFVCFSLTVDDNMRRRLQISSARCARACTVRTHRRGWHTFRLIHSAMTLPAAAAAAAAQQQPRW